MDGERIHYEVYVRRKAGSSWTLDLATEDRHQAVASAEASFKEGLAVGAKVTKETLDPETREFKTVTILNLGAVDAVKKAKVRQEVEPLCVTPQDLYTGHARERIGRLLDAWLRRHGATAFELLHRPDLVEKLETSGIDLQHAMQKISIPEAEARGCSVHELIRTYLSLVERAIQRLMQDAKKGRLVEFTKESFAGAAFRVSKEPESGYLLGSGIAAYLADASGWTQKVERILDLADAAPPAGPGRSLALTTLEQPLSEILGSKTGFRETIGDKLDLGGVLAAMTRLAAPKAVSTLMSLEPSVAKAMPDLNTRAARLAIWLDVPEFSNVRASLAKRIVEELNGMRRLRPGDAHGEIEILRALAMALTAAADSTLPLEDVQAAFSARSKMLVTGEFVDAYLGQDKTALEEVQALVWLTENVIGAGNKRQAGQWLRASAGSLRLEKEMRGGAESPAAKLATLAALQRAVGRCGLRDEEFSPIQADLGALGGQIEADCQLSSALAKAKAPAFQRISLLLRLASGETAPIGPAADRAKAEAMKLVRADEVRQELSSTDQMEAVRGLIQRAGLAA